MLHSCPVTTLAAGLKYLKDRFWEENLLQNNTAEFDQVSDLVMIQRNLRLRLALHKRHGALLNDIFSDSHRILCGLHFVNSDTEQRTATVFTLPVSNVMLACR